jgi:hypothetical protein
MRGTTAGPRLQFAGVLHHIHLFDLKISVYDYPTLHTIPDSIDLRNINPSSVIVASRRYLELNFYEPVLFDKSIWVSKRPNNKIRIIYSEWLLQLNIDRSRLTNSQLRMRFCEFWQLDPQRSCACAKSPHYRSVKSQPHSSPAPGRLGRDRVNNAYSSVLVFRQRMRMLRFACCGLVPRATRRRPACTKQPSPGETSHIGHADPCCVPARAAPSIRDAAAARGLFPPSNLSQHRANAARCP